MLYKFRYALAIVFFILCNYLLQDKFGFTGCADGWNSPSIGKQGACSHHGGVESNRTLLLIISIVGSVVFFFVVSSQYRIYDNIIVSSNFPEHPLESYRSKDEYPSTFQTPTKEAKSRKNFVCKVCKQTFKAGEKYQYYDNGRYRVKYCQNCAKNLVSINAIQSRKQQEYLNAREVRSKEIKAYYTKHAKGFLS